MENSVQYIDMQRPNENRVPFCRDCWTSLYFCSATATYQRGKAAIGTFQIEFVITFLWIWKATPINWI